MKKVDMVFFMSTFSLPVQLMRQFLYALTNDISVCESGTVLIFNIIEIERSILIYVVDPVGEEQGSA